MATQKEMNKTNCETGTGCGCPCHKATGVLTIIFGLIFLLGAFDLISQHAVSIAWPIIVILVGAKKVTQGMCKCCKMG
jgi:hypothetical protein